MAETRKHECVSSFKKWIVKRKEGAALAGALMVMFGGLAGGLGCHVLAESVYGGQFPGLAMGLAVIMTCILAPMALGVALVKVVSWCAITSVNLTEKTATAAANRFDDGDSGGPCNGSGINCFGNNKRGTKIGTALTGVIACVSADCGRRNDELAVQCSRNNRLAPASGRARLDGCGCSEPCQDCTCRREAAKKRDESASDRPVNQSGLESVGKLLDGRFALESIDALVSKISQVAFPIASACPAYEGGGWS